MNEPPNPRFYVTVTEAARMLGYSRQGILRLIKTNRLRAIRFGIPGGYGKASLYLVRKDDVQKYTFTSNLMKAKMKDRFKKGASV
jgi:excisionase family DNA binding protein